VARDGRTIEAYPPAGVTIPRSRAGRLVAWILDGTDREQSAATLGQLPPPLRLLYRAVWKPRFDKTPRR
jgi:hypothetical protein